MKKFNVHLLLDIVDDLYDLSSLSVRSPEFTDVRLEEDTQEHAVRILGDTLELCRTFGFRGPLVFTERSKSTVEQGCTYGDLNQIATNLLSRIQDDFNGVIFLWVEHDRFYKKPHLFGEEVERCIQGIGEDIEEAGTCYAVGRYTACVFHLQRIMEAGLKALAEPTGERHNPNWDAILRKIDDELRKGWEERRNFFQGKEQEISASAAMLRAVKSSWRNPTMHIDRVYDEDNALDIWNAVKGFMNSLCAIVGK